MAAGVFSTAPTQRLSVPQRWIAGAERRLDEAMAGGNPAAIAAARAALEEVRAQVVALEATGGH
jgi:hypothetical protein